MQERLGGFFDELEKIGQGIIGPALTGALLKNVAQNPIKYYAAQQRMKKGVERYRQTEEALEHPYPAGWVSMGMRPSE